MTVSSSYKYNFGSGGREVWNVIFGSRQEAIAKTVEITWEDIRRTCRTGLSYTGVENSADNRNANVVIYKAINTDTLWKKFI